MKSIDRYSGRIGSVIGRTIGFLYAALRSPRYRYITALGLFLVLYAIFALIRSLFSSADDDLTSDQTSEIPSVSVVSNNPSAIQDWRSASYQSKASRSDVPGYRFTQIIADSFSDPASWPGQASPYIAELNRDTIRERTPGSIPLGTNPVFRDYETENGSSITEVHYSEGWSLYLKSSEVSGDWVVQGMEFGRWK